MKLFWKDFEYHQETVVHKILTSGFYPDIVVGLTKGGACFATCLGYKFDCPVAYVDPKTFMNFDQIDFTNKNVLIVDDINDTGKTLVSVRNKVIKTLHPEFNENGDKKIFELNNVKYAVLIDNIPSPFDVDYFALKIDKSKNDEWIVFPWE